MILVYERFWDIRVTNDPTKLVIFKTATNVAKALISTLNLPRKFRVGTPKSVGEQKSCLFKDLRFSYQILPCHGCPKSVDYQYRKHNNN